MILWGEGDGGGTNNLAWPTPAKRHGSDSIYRTARRNGRLLMVSIVGNLILLLYYAYCVHTH